MEPLINPAKLARYLGRHPQRDASESTFYDAKAGPNALDYPCEDFEQGCPGAWRLAPLVYAVVRYARKRTDTGDRVHSHCYDQIADNPLLLAAVEYYEFEQDRAHVHRHNAIVESMRKKAEQAAREAQRK